jgi:hypothetical protein
MSRVLLPIRLALCVGLLSGCWEGISRQVLATVLSVRGEVVYGSTEKNLRAITSDSTFAVGDVIRTSDHGQVDLILIPGILARVSESSELHIEELKLVKDGNETAGGMRNRTARIHLIRGKLTIDFEQPDGASAQLSVITDQMTVRAEPGCVFVVEKDKGATRLTCVSGKVYASQKDGKAGMVAQGFFQALPSDRPEAVPATDDARAQADTTAAIKAARQLRELREAQLPPRNRFPFSG